MEVVESDDPRLGSATLSLAADGLSIVSHGAASAPERRQPMLDWDPC